MGKIVVLHFSDCFYPRINGVTVAIESISFALKNKDIDSIILAPSYEDVETIRIEELQGMDIIRIPSKRFIFNPEDRFMSPFLVDEIYNEISNKISNYSTVVFLFHNIMNSFVIGYFLYKKLKNSINLKKSTNSKIIKIGYYHTFWEYYLHYIPLPKFLLLKTLDLVEGIFFSKMDYIFVANEYVGIKISERYGLNGKVLINPLPLNKIFFDDCDVSQNLDHYLCKKYLLYVGRLGKEKNLYFLLDVFYEISKKDDNILLYIIGDGPEKKNLMYYSEKLGIKERVVFWGYLNQEEIKKFYKFSTGVIFTSKTETLGLVVLEAMACQSVIFTINTPPFNYYIKSGYNGFLIEEDKERFANKILDVIHDQNLIKRVKENVSSYLQTFHPDNFVNKMISLIGGL